MELDFVALISQTGFPIAVTVWLLYERYKKREAETKQITESLDQLKTVIVELKGLIEKLCDKL